MFPRVLGQFAGRFVGQVCQYFNDKQNREDAALAAVEIAAFIVLPPMARPLALVSRVLHLFQDRHELPLTNPRQHHANPASSPSQLGAGLACYVEGVQASDPLLMSPFGTMPLQRCFGPQTRP